MKFKGISELADLIAAEVDDGRDDFESILNDLADEGALMKFLETNRCLLKQERPVTMNVKLFNLFNELGDEVEWIVGEELCTSSFFERAGHQLYSKVGDLGMHGLFEQRGMGVWALTEHGRRWHDDYTVLIPKTVFVCNAEVVRESSDRINFVGMLNLATK